MFCLQFATVYKALDVETKQIVAVKKVCFVIFVQYVCMQFSVIVFLSETVPYFFIV